MKLATLFKVMIFLLMMLVKLAIHILFILLKILVNLSTFFLLMLFFASMWRLFVVIALLLVTGVGNRKLTILLLLES